MGWREYEIRGTGWTNKEEKVEEQIHEMGWRKRRRNVLMIEAVTWAQQAGKSLIVSDLKLEFFLFRSGTNISAEIRYILQYGRNDPVQASILSGTKQTGWFHWFQTGWTGLRSVRYFRLNPGSSGSLRTHVYPILNA